MTMIDRVIWEARRRSGDGAGDLLAGVWLSALLLGLLHLPAFLA